MIVHVVSFSPAHESPHGVGGFDWYREYWDAKQALAAQLADDAECFTCRGAACFDYTLKTVEVPDSVKGYDDITDWLQVNVEECI